MKLNNKINKNVLLLIALVATIIISCNKPVHPALPADYPKDTNPPGGPLKFYAAFDGSAVDSIRANFGIPNNVSFSTGVSGQAMQADTSKKGYISFPSANDFGSVSDFTVSLWVNATLAQKNQASSEGLLAFANPKSFWGNITMFIQSESNTSDSMFIKIHFNATGAKDNWQAQYGGIKKWPSMYDGNWHNIAITYLASDSLYTAYRDGVQFDQMTMSPAIKFENASQLVISGYQEAVGIFDTYANNSWMAPFSGSIDQVRLYGVALSATDVSALYTNKQ